MEDRKAAFPAHDAGCSCPRSSRRAAAVLLALLLGVGLSRIGPSTLAAVSARPSATGESGQDPSEKQSVPATGDTGSAAADAAADETQSSSAEEAAAPRTFALLLNGGSSSANNYLSHLHHLQDMVAALRSRGIPPDRIHVFSSDGQDPGKDLTARGVEPADYWLIDGTNAGSQLNPADLTNTVWEGVTLRPARLSELRRWFAGMSGTLRPGDTLLIFVTDHGNKNSDDPDNGFISLWNESLSVLEFRALLGYLKPGVRAVSVMSQCYSGAFSEAMTPLNSRVPNGDVCGFYSTTGDRPAYGCYPEGRDRDRLGHAFRFIDAMGRHAAMDNVHKAVLVTDTTPDVPVRTSDLFLERLLQDEAALRKLAFEDLVDQQLALAWKNRGRWEHEIRLLDRMGEVYGVFSPRALAELKTKIESLQSLSKDLDTYEDRWRLALDDLRKENLARFLADDPSWKERLEPKRVESLDGESKKSTLDELLRAVEEFTAGRPDVWSRLQDLHGMDEDAKSAKYRTDVRLAALRRMRSLLIRVAGTELLGPNDAGPEDSTTRGEEPASTGRVAGPGAEARSLGAGAEAPPPAQARLGEMKRALAALEQCEDSRIGTFDSSREVPPAMESPERLPPFEEDLAAVRRALPSWLGVRFRPVSDSQRGRLDVERGAVMVEQVYADGPAGAAGIQLGDFVLGPPGAHFTEPNQIREWTMTCPRDKPVTLDVLRDGKTIQATVSLTSFPSQLPALPAPPKAGDEAPRLGSLKMVRPGTGSVPDPARGPDPILGELGGRRHMLFFWATWCVPCKSSLPELMAWSKRTGVPVLAVSDEDEGTVRKFLDSWTGPFPGLVASDELRKSYMGYVVSGTPTFILVDEHGKIEWRQVGYSAKEGGLLIPGWSRNTPKE